LYQGIRFEPAPASIRGKKIHLGEIQLATRYSKHKQKGLPVKDKED
jgi:hypothetical protein